MESQKILYPKGKNDNCYTPLNGVLPIVKYIKPGAKIWLPFDTKKSYFYKVLNNRVSNDIICSHIDTGQDFYTYEPPHFDVIVSNPPFTNKRKIFERALSFNKPMALLMSNTWLNDKYSKWVFYEARRQMQLLMFDRRIEFTGPNVTGNKITFSSSYYCADLLPRDLIIEELP